MPNRILEILVRANVGAMNSYEITGKRWIGIAVFFLDMFKGLAVVLITKWLTNNDFLPVVLSALIVVIGHNYPFG